MKILFHYYKSLHSFNIPFSLLVSLFGLIGPNKLENVMQNFFISLMTGGFLLSVFFYGLVFENRYYFYYNKGYSKMRLITWSYLLNLLPLLVYALIKIFGL
ncbi:hypothetical protein [Chitinophaga arvensicola]|uniref:Uncharacterized protein n=1 Tax=Chitinophaga arvensicola TaxID=29529 RepID=A0A1I0S565_9BACT|nr:hypothetical protein [Chitinophaga arvensicola]SEW49760.1 hypothetical protein SAMN04488122_3562 [Chitinophaga arvensicola]